MNKQKGLAPILIVLLIALGVGGYLIYQKQTKPVLISQPSPSSVTSSSAKTGNWKTYTNNILTFQYPSNYVVKNLGSGILGIGSSEDKFNELSQSITLDTRFSGVYANYDQAVTELLKQFTNDGTHKIINMPTSVTITTGPYSISSPKLDNVYGSIVYWRYKNVAITASYNNLSKNEADEYNQILSTFKFIQ